MQKILLCVCAAVLAACAASPCFAADSPWDGTWKLNQARSKMTGETETITRAGDMYTIQGPVDVKFACDGKDYPFLENRSNSCTGGGHTFTITSKINGKVTSTSKHEISADEKMLTISTSGTRPDGTTYTSSETDVRVGSGTGLAGTWKDTKVSSSVPGMVMLKVHDGMLHWEDVGYKDSSDAKLDGTPGPVSGPTVPAGVTTTNKAEGHNKLVCTVMLNGKLLNTDIMTLSADGKSYTDVSWQAGKENEKRTYIYEKQ
jgi:hypothetical protein